MRDALVSVAIGFASGALSGMFGIGGGIITTPAIRLLMGVPALVAVGTPLPVILPSALTGAWAYHRRGMVDVQAGLVVGLSGVLTSVGGAWATRLVGGPVVLLGTAVLIVIAAGDTVLQVLTASRVGSEDSASPRPFGRLAALGALTGLYSGFFGLGGGFVLVPLLTRWMRFPLKRAIGTSLVGVAVLAVPGTLAHAFLGNIDWSIAAGLAIGVIPGAIVGSRVTAGAHDRSVRIAFAVLLVSVACWLGANEIGGLT